MAHLHPQDPSAWAWLHFSRLPLGDLRRERRALSLAERLATQPGSSLPGLFNSPGEVKATYAFLDQDLARPDTLQSTHKGLVHQRLKQPGTFLLIEDSSEFFWASPENQPIPGLGPIANGKPGMNGFILHSVLATTWPSPVTGPARRPAVEVLGLAHQHYHLRTPRPTEEGNQDSHRRKKRVRESRLWLGSGKSLGDAPKDAHKEAQTRWVRVADRGADMDAYLRDCAEKGHGFVVRSAQNRSLVNPRRTNRKKASGRLYKTVRSQSSLGEFDLELRARPGQAARTVRLSVSTARLWLRSTYEPGSAPGGKPDLAVTAVRVWEAEPPPGLAGLEWVLLCNAQAETFEQALECALQYAARWLVEEYHKGIKTGLGAQRLRLEAGDGGAADGGNRSDGGGGSATAGAQGTRPVAAREPSGGSGFNSARAGGARKGNGAQVGDGAKRAAGAGAAGRAPEQAGGRAAGLAEPVPGLEQARGDA